MRISLEYYLLLLVCLCIACINSGQCSPKNRYTFDSDTTEGGDSKVENAYYRFLYKRMKEDAAKRHISKRRHNVVPSFYSIPGPFEPLPGRSHNADYWPLFPFSSQYSGGVDLDPSTARHIGGDINIPVPSWGILDIYGRFYNRIQDTTAKFGYQAAPVNMLGLTKKDFIRLVSDPSMHYNRAAQPLIPIGKVPRTMVPMSCQAPMCNPYVHNYALGIEYDFGGHNGVEGDLDIPIPISKDVAYRFPISGNVYYHNDNLTVTYGQEFGNIDPFYSLFEYQKHLPWLYPEEDVRYKRDTYSVFSLKPEVQLRRWRSGLNRRQWKRDIQDTETGLEVAKIPEKVSNSMALSASRNKLSRINNRQMILSDDASLTQVLEYNNPFATVLIVP